MDTSHDPMEGAPYSESSSQGALATDTPKNAFPCHLLNDLKSSLQDEAHKVSFACGGVIPIVSPSAIEGAANAPVHEQLVNVEPITIRFGSDGSGRVLHLPVRDKGKPAFDQLIQTCQPATFGRGNEDVYDESYRKATKLDVTEFTTDFCPYYSGIVDIVKQALMPSISQEESRGVCAELYKLNFYSGPSGMFKAHVDTPRSESQVGSLVVALPVTFEGGSLIVRHQGKSVKFDWSGQKSPTIQWAAFYSDCEHEVEEVTAGHRLTLTYNLYATRSPELLTGTKTTLDASKLPLYQSLKDLIMHPKFKRHGVTLGLFLNHVYAHTNKKLNQDLPKCLKGIDMIFYETVRAAGLQNKLVAIIDPGSSQEHLQYLGAEVSDYWDDEELDPIAGVFYAGFKGLSIGQTDDSYDDDNSGLLSIRKCKSLRKSELLWLNKWKHKEHDTAYLTYGNEPGLACYYSSAAILVQIPPYKDRADLFK